MRSPCPVRWAASAPITLHGGGAEFNTALGQGTCVRLRMPALTTG
jgi:signal transduction histidine kinase